MPNQVLEALWKRGKDLLGSQYAIMGGAMTWVSERHLVAALSNAGAFGILASGSMNGSLLEEEIVATQQKTKYPFGVNLILMNPALEELLDACIRRKVTHVILAGGVPKQTIISRLKNHQIKVLTFAPSLAIAKKMVRDGADGLIIEGMEAGGHIGAVSTTVLAQEILPYIHEVPIFMAGGIGRGEAIASYLKMGASGVQLGTRFVCASECIAHPNFKKVFIKAKSRDATLSFQVDPRFPVIPVRAIANRASQDFIIHQGNVLREYTNGRITLKEGQLKIEHYWAGALRRAVLDGDVEYGSLMAGQSVGLVEAIEPTQTILQNLEQQALSSLGNNLYISRGNL